MKMLVSCLCDHAWVENGCLSIVRTFDSIKVPKFPHSHPRLSIALRMLFRRTEAGLHKMSIVLINEDGKKIINADLNMDVKIPDESLQETSFSFALNAQNVVFPKSGDYAIDIIVDGRVEASIPLYLRDK